MGKVFVQAESETAAINMVYGAAAAGARTMTTSSSPGIALMQEGMSYLCGSELPCVLVNVMRGGPGLGGIQPSQADYYQITRGGGNGDYRVLSFAPENLQETVDLMKEAFDIADFYRNPVMIAVDGLIGQMMETVDLHRENRKRELPDKDWAACGAEKAACQFALFDPAELERHNFGFLKIQNDGRKRTEIRTGEDGGGGIRDRRLRNDGADRPFRARTPGRGGRENRPHQADLALALPEKGILGVARQP